MSIKKKIIKNISRIGVSNGDFVWEEISLDFRSNGIYADFTKYKMLKYQGWFGCSGGNVFPQIPVYINIKTDNDSLYFPVSIQGSQYNNFGNIRPDKIVIRGGSGSAPEFNNYSNDGNFKLFGVLK